MMKVSNSFTGSSPFAERTDFVEQPSEREVRDRALLPSHVNYNRVRDLHLRHECDMATMAGLTM